MNRRGGIVYRLFKIKGKGTIVGVSTYFAAGGKLEQFFGLSALVR
jgi:hypothetical protein